MKLNIVSEKENQVLKRKELEVKIIQEASTPSRESLKKQLSKDLNIPEERISIQRINQPFGKKDSTAEVRVYSTKEELAKIERPYIIGRGGPKQKGAAPAKPEKKEEAEKSEEGKV